MKKYYIFNCPEANLNSKEKEKFRKEKNKT